MRHPVTSPAPARKRFPLLPRRPSFVIAALSGLGVAAVAAALEFVMTHSMSVGSRPSLTLGAMVTMVGPLGVTFPCWAARHVARRATDAQ